MIHNANSLLSEQMASNDIIKAGRPFYLFITQLVDKQVMDQR